MVFQQGRVKWQKVATVKLQYVNFVYESLQNTDASKAVIWKFSKIISYIVQK